MSNNVLIENKKGYKKTKLGWIPEDWDVFKLGDFFTLTSGVTKPYDLHELQGCNDNPVFGGNGIIGYSKKALLNQKVLIIGRVGEKCGCVHYLKTPCWVTDNALYTNNIKKNFNYEYMYYLLQKINLNRYRNKGGQPLVSQKPIYCTIMAMPKINEQEKIAEILSAWDDGIETLKKLIQRNEIRYKSILQKKLVGNNRLKNCLIEITEKNSKNLVKNVLSVTNSRGFINQDEQFERNVASKNLKIYKIIKQHQFAYNPSRINVGSIALLTNFDFGIVSPIYVVFITDETKLLSTYLKHYFKAPNFFKQMKTYTQGGVRENLSFKALQMMKLKIPSIDEQIKITKLLDMLEQEIQILNSKLEKLKEQKKGLMQKLLTGQIRVRL